MFKYVVVINDGRTFERIDENEKEYLLRYVGKDVKTKDEETIYVTNQMMGPSSSK